MLDSVEGRVVRLDADAVVLECGSFWLRIEVPASAVDALRPGERARLWCHLALRDETFRLFGFPREVERDFFVVLQGVSGLGPEKARGLLAALGVEAITAAVRARDAKRFRTVRGIGQKLAERLVIELNDKVDRFALPGPAARGHGGAVFDDLVATMLRLGYPKATAEAAAEAAIAARGDDAPLEDLVKHSLRALQRPTAASGD